MAPRNIMWQSLRRLAIVPARVLGRTSLNCASPAILASGKHFQTRKTTSSSKIPDPKDLLRKQRLNRPTSPNLSIYRPQITSVLSLLHRNTGLAVSGGFYLFFAAYVASPWLGWHIDSASMATSFETLPLAAKVFLKTTVTLPFTFHCFNGVRHLVWDSGRALGNKQVIKSGWAVVGLSISCALLLGFL
ncbi:succinate dehydrogenase, cytochrome b556 subunit [Emergomyces pasteurianus Ep9510]|uniref:Succinate dehydrogenase, cytochrome b556 subunit n=1 Tax=Emergomyces pasteurianus Ep9510 TaxID=1447872 RepID=A0A1J9P6A1_9EURO|nr:succinate dehydrogenase, cytochrome b556 subunit [Emergomyces pasteurianus Ep9510]